LGLNSTYWAEWDHGAARRAVSSGQDALPIPLDAAPPTVRRGFGISARAIQIALGVLWLIDAALQFQPSMFTHQLVTDIILPNVHGQPQPVSWSITTAGDLFSHGTASWNAAFAVVQLAIGVGLLLRRFVRPALIVMFAWCFGVWWIGEGFGGLLAGTASPLTGSPGAVALYAVIGILVWPRRVHDHPDQEDHALRPDTMPARVGVASSGTARGPFGLGGALTAWSGLWVLSAVLWVLPVNRAADTVSRSIAAMSDGNPEWYGHFLTSTAHQFAGDGAQTAWILAALSLLIGLGPLFTARPLPFLLAGSVLQIGFWITGMAFGGILTGHGTDPNAAPLVILLAVGLIPVAVASHQRFFADAPVRVLSQRHPGLAIGSAATAITLVVLGVGYPLVAEASPPTPAVQSIPLQTVPDVTSPPVTTPSGQPALTQFNAPSTFSCLTVYPSQAQVTIGWHAPTADRVTVRFDGAPIHIGLQDALPFDVPAGKAPGPGTTIVFACAAGDHHRVTLQWDASGLRPMTRTFTVTKVASP
jgi:hypothetical protein